jgi:WS/DGAT/MGAT family acyltransferase
MSHSHYDRLSAMDAAFLDIEDGNAHMHIGSAAIFDAAPLATPEGGIDYERILEAQEASLRTTVRFRQKLAWVPRLGHPVWVDDPRFNLSYHVRHSALPAPGNLRQLKRLVGRIMSQQLDRGKPLWECWYVEGLEGGRFAMITKVHHCLADGVSGTELFAGMLSPEPQRRPEPPRPWVPRPAPSGVRLLADELSRRARLPWDLLWAGGRAAAGAPRSLAELKSLARAAGDVVAVGLSPASETPFNADLGPHRRFDWTRFDLAAMREVKEHFGCKLNDVVLCVVAGAVRRFLRGRGLRTEDIDFRAMIPVNVRSGAQRGALGNRVSQMLARLPVDEADPIRRLERVVEVTRELKRSSQVAGIERFTEIADVSGIGLIARLARLGLALRAINLVVTNVPGPPVPLYLAGAPLLEVYPVVPLGPHQALGIALFSYAGGFHWGFNADWDALPDLHHLVEAVDVEFEALRKAAVPQRPPP